MWPGAHESVRGVGHDDPRASVQRTDRPTGGGLASRVVRFGVLGAVPGLLLALVPLILHDVGVLTADQSQIGFIGVPVLFLGVFVGTAIATADSDCDITVMVGLAVGFVLGLVGGLFVAAVLLSVGVSVGGLWLLIAPSVMIAGAFLAARHCEPTHGLT